MADEPATGVDTQQLADAVQDLQMGKIFLALLNPKNAEDASLGEGAQNAHQNWFLTSQRRLQQHYANDPEALAGASNPEVVQQLMAEAMIDELVKLNQGRDISDAAKAEVTRLMQLDAEEFAKAITDNAEAVNAAVEALKEKQKTDPEAQLEIVGIMAVLSEPTEYGRVPRLSRVDVSGVGVSPSAQVETTTMGVFNAMSEFMHAGGNAEAVLARIAGMHVGAFDENTLTYEGMNPIRGPGGLSPEDHQAWVQAFASEGGVGGGLNNDSPTYALTDVSPSGPANMDMLFTQPMVDRGLIQFASDDAREAWNTHLSGGLALRLSGEELEQRMEQFAGMYSDITLKNERTPDAGRTVEGWAEAAAEVAEYDEARAEVADPVSAHGVEVYSADPAIARVFDPTVPAGAANMNAVREVAVAMSTPQTPMPGVEFGMQPGGNNPELGMGLRQA